MEAAGAWEGEACRHGSGWGGVGAVSCKTFKSLQVGLVVVELGLGWVGWGQGGVGWDGPGSGS